MKFRVERDALADAVSWAARSLSTRPTMPVLAGLLLTISAEKGYLREIGNLLFHFSLLGLLIAIALGSCSATRGR